MPRSFETRVKEGTVTVTERVIQDGGRQSVVLHQKQGRTEGCSSLSILRQNP